MVEYKVLKDGVSWYQIMKDRKNVFGLMPLKEAKSFAKTVKQNDTGAKVEVYKVTLVGRVIL